MTDQALPDRRIFFAVALIAGGALLLEVVLIRLLSVALWYPFAFAGISTAMLGFGGAAVAVSLSTRLRALPIRTLLMWTAMAFCLSTVVGYPIWNALPVAPMSLGQDASQIFWTGMLLVLVTMPFVAAGMFISRVFSAWPAASPMLYAADLGGATVGVLAYIVILPLLGGPGSLFLAGSVGAVAALTLYEGGLHGRIGFALVTAILLASAAEVESILPLRITENKLLGTAEAKRLPRGSVWTLSSAIDVIEPSDRSDPVIIIDGGTAMTNAPRAPRSRVPPAPRGLRALAYVLNPGASTLVIGSGGGVEVSAALGAGSKRILALEIDAAINDLVRGRLATILAGIFAHPAVELRTAEARSYLAAHDETFDAIVAFHTISNAASSTGAMSLAENYLLTEEAMALLLSRLSDKGVLVMSRPEQQLGRLASTLAAAWPFESDVHQHVAIFTHSQQQPDFLAALVISRRPLRRLDVEALRAEAPGRVVYLPDGSGDAQDYFAATLAWGHPQAEARIAAAATALPYRPATPVPVTDDRPFFNLHQPWSALSFDDVRAVLSSGVASRARLEDLPVAQTAILLLLFEALFLALLFVIPPAIILRRHGVAAGRAARLALYFAAIGYAFITVEVVLIQKLTLIVGEPAWSMVAVLAVLLASSGLGSMILAGRLGWSPTRGCFFAASAALFVALLLPMIVDAAAVLPFAARLLVVVLLVAPVGFLMGVPFSAALKGIDRDDLVAWAWALNSLMSVGGSIAALVVGSSIGFAATAMMSALVYGGAAWAGRRIA